MSEILQILNKIDSAKQISQNLIKKCVNLEQIKRKPKNCAAK